MKRVLLWDGVTRHWSRALGVLWLSTHIEADFSAMKLNVMGGYGAYKRTTEHLKPVDFRGWIGILVSVVDKSKV
jgi:hypothetical protein